jgi:aspartate aminotransferase-like enzyme
MITNKERKKWRNEEEKKKMHPKLFIPGPVDVSPDVLEQMKKPMIGHRSKDCFDLFESCVKNLKRLMFTQENDIIISTSSSTGLMEAAIVNCVKKKCLNFVCGAFGERWHEITKACGKVAEKVEVEPGEAITPEVVEEALSKENYDAITLVHNETSSGVTNPIYEISKVMKKYEDVCFLVDSVSSMAGIKLEVDKLGIDVCLFGTQKALALPPGLAVCSVSEKALENAKLIEHKGFYFDFLTLLKYAKKFQTPATPAISLMYALDYKLKKILDEEGLENRYERHKKLGEIARKWAKRNFELLPKEKYASNTVTCVKNTRNIDIQDLKQKLAQRGYVFAPGYGKVAATTFRIGHMGDRTEEELKKYLEEIDEILGL